MTEQERQDITHVLKLEVKGGFSSEEELLEYLEDDLENTLGDFTNEDVAEARTIALKLFDDQRQEEATWNEPTVNDAIDAAFNELNKRGIIALQNAGFTVNDGWADVHEAVSE